MSEYTRESEESFSDRMNQHVVAEGDAQCESCETMVAEDQIVHCAACGKAGCQICTIEISTGERVCMVDGQPDPDCERKELESYLCDREREYERDLAKLDEKAAEMKGKLYLDYDADITKVSKRLEVLNGSIRDRVTGALMTLDILAESARRNNGRTTITAASLVVIADLIRELKK